MLTPSYTNAIILYGQDACNRFEGMVDYWTTILEPVVWNQFLFVLVSDGKLPEPVVPRDVEEVLRRNTWLIRTDCTACPANITDAIRQRLIGGRALLQCVCADFAQAQPGAHNAVCLVDSIVQAFPQGVVDTIYYLLLQTDVQATISQRNVFSVLQDHLNAHIYLLSDMADDASTIDGAILWRAVFGEMLANSAYRRTLMNGQLYSLGYSSLNANDSELRNLRCQKAYEVVRRKAAHEITPAEAWRIITQSNDALGDTSQLALRTKVEQWMMHVASHEITLPNETERRNNRILSGVYQLELNMSAMENAIERFYSLNSGSGEPVKEARERLKEKYLLKMVTTLRNTINADSFPIWLVDSLIAQLNGMEQYVPRKSNKTPPKRKWMMSAVDYCNACCDVFEANCAAAAPLRMVGLCAGALRDALEALRAFLYATRGLAEIIGEQILKTDQLEYLKQKYPKYWACVQDTEHDRGETLFDDTWEAAHAPFYAENGMPIAETWRSLIADGEKQLQHSMMAQFPGSFCNVVNQECPTADALSNFFDRYLTESRRMLYNISNPRSVPRMLYYADRSFINHPWIIAIRNDCETARNDNVERFDIYPLTHDLKWYLNNPDNLYLNAITRPHDSGSDAPHLWSTRAFIPEQASQNAPKAVTAGEDLTRGLTLHADDQRYILAWTWMPHTNTAVVTFAREGRELRTMPCSEAEFAPAQGLDVSSVLPYGKIEVSVYVNGKRYAYREMAGRKNQVRYRLEHASDGTVTLQLKGRREDMCKLVLCVGNKGTASNLLYPINAARADELYSIHGLRLPIGEETSVMPSPEDPYPTVQAIKGK